MEGNTKDNKTVIFTPGAVIKEVFVTDKTKIVAQVVNSSNGVKYISIRKFYLKSSGDIWMPSGDKITIPYELKNELAMPIFNYEE
jgi:hypothetical protein